MTNPLRNDCEKVMRDPEIQKKYPDGVTAGDVLKEIREQIPGAYPLCTVLDVHDELVALYGRPSQ